MTQIFGPSQADLLPKSLPYRYRWERDSREVPSLEARILLARSIFGVVVMLVDIRLRGGNGGFACGLVFAHARRRVSLLRCFGMTHSIPFRSRQGGNHLDGPGGWNRDCGGRDAHQSIALGLPRGRKPKTAWKSRRMEGRCDNEERVRTKARSKLETGSAYINSWLAMIPEQSARSQTTSVFTASTTSEIMALWFAVRRHGSE